MTASEASQAFSALLDEAQHGETIIITRAGRRVATIAPAGAATWSAFCDVQHDWKPTDDPTLEPDVAVARDAVTLDGNPWPDKPCRSELP